MPSNFRHSTIPQSLANALEKEIRDGTWYDELPGNRELAEHYQLSCYSVLKALKILETRGFVQPAEKGKRRKISEGAAKKEQKQNLKLLIVSGKYKNTPSEDKYLINMLENAWNTMQGVSIHVQAEMSRISQPEKTITRWIKNHSPDAILIYLGARKWINDLVDTRLPVYCMGGEIADRIDQISSYGYSIPKTLTYVLKKLRQQGHTRVQFPRRLGRTELNESLLDTYRAVFGDIYSDEELKEFITFFPEDSPEQWRKYWSDSFSRIEPTAVICDRLNDLLSLYGFCNSAKIDIPQNISVVSLSNSEHLQWLWPPPTQIIYPDKKNLAHFRRWIKSDFQMRDNTKISLTLLDGESVRTIKG